jgi:hypothetical protein
MNKESIKRKLKELLRGTYKVYIVQTKVSSSGMSRRLQLYVYKDGYMNCITWDVAELRDYSVNQDGILVSGCGMDMHFATADAITSCLWGKRKPKSLRGNGGTCLDWQSL